jgi:hypothetical protein
MPVGGVNKRLHQAGSLVVASMSLGATRGSSIHLWTAVQSTGRIELRACDKHAWLLVTHAVLQTSGLATKQLRAEATALGMDCSWCLERSELLEAFKRAKQVPGVVCLHQMPCKCSAPFSGSGLSSCIRVWLGLACDREPSRHRGLQQRQSPIC